MTLNIKLQLILAFKRLQEIDIQKCIYLTVDILNGNKLCLLFKNIQYIVLLDINLFLVN